MAAATKAEQIGFKQAFQIGQMPAKQRLDFIAEGLPIIHESAKSLIAASRALTDFPREAEILEGHAIEECAKLLILVDLVRCPPKRAPARIGAMVKWFYSHLARLIYAEAQMWKPVSFEQLQEYVDHHRPTHYLEGDYSEYIMPNMTLFRRESSLDADVIGNEDAAPAWSSPEVLHSGISVFEPMAWRVVDALDAFGLFSREGVEILSRVWGGFHFQGNADWSEGQPLYEKMATASEKAGLLQERLTGDHQSTLYGAWQMPMYEIDFSPIPVTLEELKAARERAFWNEI
jgi:hypothetical protein